MGDVGRAEIDVILARDAVAGDRPAQPVLLVLRGLVEEELAVDEEARRDVDLRQQVRLLAQHAVLVVDGRSVHRVAHPQVARQLDREGPTLARRRRPRAGGQPVRA